jgi:tRNA-dihydrouridine synthase B
MIYKPNGLILAPLAGYTDLPYRKSARRHGCEYAFCEMVDAGSLVYGTKKTIRFLDRDPVEDWLGVQLLGSDTKTLKEATKILNEYEFDVLDFNLGCPAPKVSKKGEGAELARQYDKAIAAFSAITSVSNKAVTAKIRILDDTDPQPTIRLCQGLVDEGVKCITIHGRIKEKFYSGDVHFNILKAVREAIPDSVQIVANGGVMSPVSYQQIMEESTLSEVMVARGAMGNPWIFNYLKSQENFIPPTHREFVTEVELHINEMIDYYGDILALKIARKVILDYLKGRGYGGTIKSKVSTIRTVVDFNEFLKLLSDGPADSYWKWLETVKQPERPMRKES